MKHRIKLSAAFLLMVITVFPLSVSGQQISLSLKDAVNNALENNNKVKQYSSKVDQKKWQNYESWGNFLPQVTLNASYNHLNDPLIIDLSPVRDAMITLQAGNSVEFANIYNMLQGLGQLSSAQRGALYTNYSNKLNSAIPQFTSVMKDQDYKSASFTGIQPIFTGGKLLAAKLFASGELDAAQTELKQVKDEIKKDAIQKYLSVVLLNDVLKIKHDVYDAVKKHRDRADKLLKQGLIANYNLLRAEVALADAEKGIDETQEKLELAMLDLKNCIGFDESVQVSVIDTLSYKKITDSLALLTQSGPENNYILKLIDYKKYSVKQKYKIEMSNFLPTLALFGKYEMYPQYLSILEPRWAVGVSLSINIFNGFRDFSKLESASCLQDELNHIYDDAKGKIKLLITKNYKDMQNSETNYLKNKKTQDLAAENLRLNEKRFETGLGISLEVIDAYLSYEKTETDARKYLFDFYSAYAELCYNTGIIDNATNIFNGSSK